MIPTNPFYDIDLNGVVRLISTNEIIPEYLNRNGRRSVKIRGKSHKVASHPLDRLMLNTFKPLPLGKDPEWMSVKFADGCRDNIDIDNIEWDGFWFIPNPLFGIEFGVTSWMDVYGIPELQIRLDRNEVYVRNSLTYADVEFSLDVSGYRVVNLPGTNRNVSHHRLVALTCLPHPIDVDHLTVNHKDSNKTNNAVSNLEWATYTENNAHAFSDGPRSETVRKIRLRNLQTHDETVVSGYNEMARHLGVLPQAAHQAMERRKYEGRPYKGYVFKFDDDPRSWETLRKSGPRDTMIIPKMIARKNLDTGDVKVYTSFRNLLKEEDIRDFMVFRLINSKPTIPWRRRLFRTAEGFGPFLWPDYPKEIVAIYDDVHSSDRPIAVSDRNGFVKYYTSVTSWCAEDRENRCDPAVLSRYMKKDKICQWRDWVFTYIDLSRYPTVYS